MTDSQELKDQAKQPTISKPETQKAPSRKAGMFERKIPDPDSLQVMSEDEEKEFVQFLKEHQEHGPYEDEYIIKKPVLSKK